MASVQFRAADISCNISPMSQKFDRASDSGKMQSSKWYIDATEKDNYCTIWWDYFYYSKKSEDI